MDSPLLATLRRLLRLLPPAVLAFVLTTPPGAAQLDLPKPAPGGGEARPGGSKKPGDLDLPKPGTGGEAGGAEGVVDNGAQAGRGAAVGHVEFLRRELRKEEDPDSRLVQNSVSTLIGLGDSGLAAAREMLREEHAATLVVGARVLLTAGSPSDRQAVRLMPSENVPTHAAGALLEALAELDPEWATPERMVGFLDHSQTAMRAAAQRYLRGRVDETYAPYLERMLSSERTDTRERALDLAVEAGGSGRRGLLLGALGDPSSRVSRRAAELLAIVEGADVGGELIALWEGPASNTRVRAYALLAIAEVEDRRGVAVLGDEHAPRLLEAMESSSPLSSFAAAISLAGIGFRSRRPSASEWLDLEVPHALVKAVSGDTFHADFSSTQVPARRRLEQISGQILGADGIAWRRWWLAAAPTFRARRAWIETGVSSFANLAVEVRGASEEETYRLLGPLLAEAETAVAVAGALDTYYLSETHARILFERLSELELFTAARLPGVRGRSGQAQRTLMVRLGDQEKRFTLGSGVLAPWFDAALLASSAAREASSWQRWPDPDRYASRLAFWVEERDWWDAEHSVRERNLREKQLVLAYLRGLSPEAEDDLARRLAVTELVALYALPDIPEAADLPHVLAAITATPFYGPQVGELADVAIASARAARGGTGPVSADLGVRIVETLHERYRVDATVEMAEVLVACEPAAALEASTSASSYVRTAAARALGELRTPECLSGLRELLDDRSPSVEAAAVAALGLAGVEEARADILSRAHESLPNVRVAALLAAAQLGGDGVLEELRSGLIEQDPGVQVAAAEGLAILAEPSSAPILIDMLGRGPRHPFFEHARDGLRRMGASAHAALLREAQSGPRFARREAGLLLSQQGVAEAVPVLVMLLTEDPADAVVAEELAVLTCVDFRPDDDPAMLWWDWWDAVPQEDSLVWLCEAGGRVLNEAVSPADLKGAGTGRGARALLKILAAARPHVQERARRELSLLLGFEVEPPPAMGEARTEWQVDVLAKIEARYGR